MQILNIQDQTQPGASPPGANPSGTGKATQTGQTFGDLFAKWTAVTHAESPEEDLGLLSSETAAEDIVESENLPDSINKENQTEPATPTTTRANQLTTTDDRPDPSAPSQTAANPLEAGLPKLPELAGHPQDAPPHWQRMSMP